MKIIKIRIINTQKQDYMIKYKKENKFMQNSYKKRKKHLDEKKDFS